MSVDNDVPWSGPEPDDPKEPWQQDEPPSRPLKKPGILPPSKRDPFFRWIGGVLTPEPKCPRCRGDVEYRRANESCWCRACGRGFYHRSVADLLREAGIWFL